MERRAGKLIENFADENMKAESKRAYEKEMSEIFQSEQQAFEEEICDLGVAVIEDEFIGDPSSLFEDKLDVSFEHQDAEQSDPHVDSQQHEENSDGNDNIDHSDVTPEKEANTENLDCTPSQDDCEPLGSTPQSEALPEIYHCRRRRPETILVAETAKKRRLNFLPRTRTGMTVCADHAWQKRGFDSLTGHTYLLSKENKVLKTVVKHRTCGVCKWWRRRRPGQKPRHHRCVWNHKGSSRLMESEAGVEAVKEMNDQGTPIAVIEGDGDNTLIARLKSNLGLTVKKKLDKNHCTKNIR